MGLPKASQLLVIEVSGVMAHDSFLIVCVQVSLGKQRKAKLCLVCSDSSQRVYDEFVNLCENHKIPVFRISPTINELHRTIGYKAGIITVNDQGFASSVMKKLTTENEPGEEHDI